MSSMIFLGNGTKVTGTGTLSLEGRRVAGYICADGTNTATVTVRDGSATGPLIFEWSSAIPASFWPTLAASGDVYYSVAGTNAYLLLHEVVL